MSCAFSLSAARPSCSVRETILRSSCCRSSNLFLNWSSFFLSIGVLGCIPSAHLIAIFAIAESKMISAKEKQRQLGKHFVMLSKSVRVAILPAGSDHRYFLSTIKKKSEIEETEY